MNGYAFTFAGENFVACGSGALWWPATGALVVSDLHFGKSARRARNGAQLLPPYDTAETLRHLEHELERTGARSVICLGDSFDDPGAAAALSQHDRDWLIRLQHGRDWAWIEGNHDPAAIGPGGGHLKTLQRAGLCFRHIASPQLGLDEPAEISGHYHPKASLSLRGAGLSRPCFLLDGRRLILPAFGTYTGGLSWQSAALSRLMQPGAIAILTGPRPVALRLPLARKLPT